jgi:hypothetical protein
MTVATPAPAPQRPRHNRGLILLGVVLSLASAAGGYALARSQGSDLDAARAQGVRAGRALGAARGAHLGQRAGLAAGRKATYAPAKQRAARHAYRAAIAMYERAAQAEAAAAASRAAARRPLVELPNGRPGYALPPSDRTLACVGVDASTGQCVGD